MRILATVCVALLVLAAAVGPAAAAPVAPASTAGTDASPVSTATSSSQVSAAPDDPEEDVLGWEDGYWYNESISVDRSDGLNDEELDAVVARAAARVEEVRGIEFDSIPPVEVISRAEYREENAGRFANASAKDRLHQNVKWEAVFMADEQTDALSELQSNRGSGVLGYYSPTDERIVIVGEDTESPELNEITLAQELFHALQDQQWDLSSYNRSTTEENNAVNGIVEGDGNYVDYLYQQRCEDGSWGECLMPQGQSGGGGDLNVGMYAVSFQPYSDGPPFVKGIRDEGGWEAVNAVYDDPPASTEQVIHPGTYGEDAPTEVSIEDRSNESWRVLDVEGPVDHAQFGEAGIFTMFWYASFQKSQRSGSAQTVVVPYSRFFNRGADGNVDSFDPYNYNHSVSAGWDGDRLLPYVTDDSAETNETGYVWKTEWDSEQDADEFAAGYRELLAYHGAERVGQDTYRIPDGGYADAFHISRDGSTVTVVNAPTVEALSGVDSAVEVQEVTTTATTATTVTTTAGTTGDGTTGAGTTTTTGDGASDTTDGGTDTTGTTGPGFGALAALAALLGAAALLARRG